MAKEIQCPLCDKKIIKKFFGKEHGDLWLGETFIFDCCRECCDKYKAFADKHGKTFSVKLKNLEDRTNQVLDSNERGQLFLQFYEEAQKYEATKTPATHIMPFYSCDNNGRFYVPEYRLNFLTQSGEIKDMIQNLENLETNIFNHLNNSSIVSYFTKDDISKIEYCILSGVSDGLMRKVYPVVVRFNDEGVMTFKPCITKTVVYGTGISKKQSAEENVLKMLAEFCQHIGATDIPIVHVKDFN